MPELPEVQTIVNDLQTITGDIISGFWTNFEKAVKTKSFEKEIAGKKILKVERLGKNIILKLNSGHNILLHLKMTGRILVSNQSSVISNQEKYGKHVHHIFFLNKKSSLVFHDVRKFATLELANAEKLLEIENKYGIDPFSKKFTAHNFAKIFKNNPNKNLKMILMNQALISGIGNIYASEIPFAAKVSPLKLAKNLQESEVLALFKFTLKILTKAIKMRGTSFSDYRDAKGEKGGFQDMLKVYGKAGKKCTICDTIIEKVVVEQRSTFFCKQCQH